MRKIYSLLIILTAALLVTTVNAAIPITWSPYIPIQISNTTSVQATQPLFFDYFSLGNNSLLFHNVNIGSGRAISYLNISSVGANLTLNHISAVDQTSLMAVGNGNATVTFIGFGQAPASVVTGENVPIPYVYSTNNDTLQLSPSISTSQNILINFAQSDDSALGLAVVALLVGATFGSVALIFALRRRNSEE